MTRGDILVDRRRRDRDRRHGYTLVLFVMLLFGIMAMATLVIDIGFARLTQRRMQTAADAAAIAGLRFRDQLPTYYLDQENPPPFLDPNNLTPAVGDTEAARRTEASRIAGWIVEGHGDLDRSQAPTELQINYPDNHANGDLVAGEWLPAADYVTDGQFVPDGSDNAFLVRLRRTGETFAQDPTTASSGPPLPYLFGYGSLLNRQQVADGIRFSATAIADARPAVTVGVDLSDSGIPGALPLAIRKSVWAGLPCLDEVDVDNGPSFQTREVDGSDIGFTTVAARSIGDTIVWDYVESDTNDDPVEAPADRSLAPFGYVAIFDSIGGVDRVIGFGYLEIALPVDMDSNQIQVRKLVRNASAISGSASATGAVGINASSRLSDAWDGLSRLSTADRNELLNSHRRLGDPLLAPVLVDFRFTDPNQ